MLRDSGNAEFRGHQYASMMLQAPPSITDNVEIQRLCGTMFASDGMN
jgi:hypothetical protein